MQEDLEKQKECRHDWNLFRVKKYPDKPAVVIGVCRKCLLRSEDIWLVDPEELDKKKVER